MTFRKAVKNDRRLILKLASVGTLASMVIPSKWSKPIVSSMILPAHAQTSVTMLSIDGFSLDVETIREGDINQFGQFYQIDDISNPKIISVTSQSNAETFQLQTSLFEQQGLDTSTTIQVDVEIGLVARRHTIDSSFDDATNSAVISLLDVPATVSAELISLSGDTWEVSYSVSLIGIGEMMFEDFTFTRV